MDLISNLLSGNRRKPRSNPSVISNSSDGIRCKWPHRRMHTKPSKRTDPESSTASVEASPVAESNLGLTRVPVNDQCVVCFNNVDYLYILEKCGHRACLDCWRTFTFSQVSSFAMAHITCIACNRKLSNPLTLHLLKPCHHSEIVSIGHQVSAENLYQRYEEFLFYQCLLRRKSIRWCPCGCGYAVFADRGFRIGLRLKCQPPHRRGGSFCYRCRGPWGNADNNHVCSQPNITVATAAGGGGGIEGSNTCDNQRSVLLRLHQLFRFPAADATPTDAAAAPVRISRQKVDAELHDDVESDSMDRLRLPSAPLFSTSTIPIQAADAIRTSIVDDTQSADGIPDAEISQVDLVDLPGDVNGQVKPCPRCKTLLLKLFDGSCNHMNCFICGCEFCWLCLREVGDTHFLSPTGCTFWGRRKWPIRRRIWAMLVAALGTPLILAILTTLAVPAIAIGFPSYLVKKVGRRVKSSKLKRVLLQSLSFLGGLIVSPLIWALVTLLGTPLMLIYVYIFMPITLFAELRVRHNSDTTNAIPIDPDLGFKVNWDRVGESATAAPSSAPNDGPEVSKAS